MCVPDKLPDLGLVAAMNDLLSTVVCLPANSQVAAPQAVGSIQAGGPDRFRSPAISSICSIDSGPNCIAAAFSFA